MKALLLRKVSFIVFVYFIINGCYSVEFFPTVDYPNLKDSGVEKVQITRVAPEREHNILGTLIFKEFTGDLNGENFRKRIRSEAKKRGAAGAWIISRRFKTHAGFRTEARNSRSRHRQPTGRIQKRMGIVKVILFNYERKNQNY